jgi:Flp pilus assembly protein TadD
MSRTVVAAATVIAVLMAGTPVLAQTDPATTAPRSRADEATRAAYERRDALSRSVFWANEQQADPMDPVAGVRLSAALRELGRFDAAAEAAQNTLLAQPENTEALLELGRAHWARGQAFYGIAALEKARDLMPGDWRPWSLLGAAYEQVRRHDDAEAAWRQALAISPDNPAVLTNMAMAQMAANDLAGAETLLRRATAQSGATMQMRLNLALVLGLQGKTGEAEALLRRDLPPELADRNLQWLRDRTEQASTAGRTWGSLQ